VTDNLKQTNNGKPIEYKQERRVASAILYNAQGQILLQFRDNKPGLPEPHTWTPFGGQIEPGEDPDDGIRRELVEEIELIDVELTRWKTLTCPVRSTPEMDVIHYSYMGQIAVGLDDLVLREGEDMAFFDAANISGLRVAFGQLDILEEFVATYLQPKSGDQ
jgi:ADP-ribose pyrophosphatase YjhB (NUDIX family)